MRLALNTSMALRSHPQLSSIRSRNPQTCSESHPSLSQLAEPYLYAHVLLKTDESQLENLTELLSKCPYIAHYIRSLEIYVSGHEEARHRCLRGISTILPYLLALKMVTLDNTACPYWGWVGHPESFRRAFLDCLCFQSMQDVCINQVYAFPFRSALNGECKSIRSLTVSGCLWRHPNPSQINNLLTNQGFPLKSLCIKSCGESFVKGFAVWFATCGSPIAGVFFI